METRWFKFNTKHQFVDLFTIVNVCLHSVILRTLVLLLHYIWKERKGEANNLLLLIGGKEKWNKLLANKTDYIRLRRAGDNRKEDGFVAGTRTAYRKLLDFIYSKSFNSKYHRTIYLNNFWHDRRWLMIVAQILLFISFKELNVLKMSGKNMGQQTFLGYRTDFSEIKERSLAIHNSHSHSKQLGRPSIQCIYYTMRLIPII